MNNRTTATTLRQTSTKRTDSDVRTICSRSNRRDVGAQRATRRYAHLDASHFRLGSFFYARCCWNYLTHQLFKSLSSLSLFRRWSFRCSRCRYDAARSWPLDASLPRHRSHSRRFSCVRLVFVGFRFVLLFVPFVVVHFRFDRSRVVDPACAGMQINYRVLPATASDATVAMTPVDAGVEN
jgi:hypothetical protein